VRIGHGYDSHRFEEGRRLFLGGVEIPDHIGLKGHSDADVLIHAIIDSLFGAASLGNIGSHFPDTDKAYEGVSSLKLLSIAAEKVARAGYLIVNIDTTVVCETPRLQKYVESMCQTIADCIGIARQQISIKGKTNEMMDDVGARIGIVAYSVCLLEEKRHD
jgi:2-C-methyl-D-erythritol 2,4-cyclodiphosphate synthase